MRAAILRAEAAKADAARREAERKARAERLESRDVTEPSATARLRGRAAREDPEPPRARPRLRAPRRPRRATDAAAGIEQTANTGKTTGKTPQKKHAQVLDIHGRQKQQKRTSTFFEFCRATSGVLLCTDVAARGLDIPEVNWIVQFDPPV